MSSSVKNIRADVIAAMLDKLQAVAAKDPSIVELVRLLLTPLEHEDGERGNNLAATLRAYYAAGARVDKTADALFLHRNSVRYRLDRIRSLVGLDIDQPDVIAALTVALACRDHSASAAVEHVSSSRTVRGNTHAS
jgi:DNA-binding PucR family transcriptional regulator